MLQYALQKAGFKGAPGGLDVGLLGCENIAQLRSLSPLPDEAQRLIDRAVVNVGLERLTVIADVLNAGLVFPLDDWLGTPEVYWESASKAGDARRVMDPEARGENQQQDLTPHRIPVYATIDDYRFGVRLMRTAARNNYPIDTSMVEQATRRVNESLEDQAINGAAIAVGGNSAPGLLNAPNKATWNFSGGEAWDAAGHDGQDILSDTLAGIAKLQANNRFGPYHLWVPTLYGNKLNENFVVNYPGTIRERLLAIDSIRGISVADRLPADTVVLAQMTSDIMDVILGQSPIALSWRGMGPFGGYHHCVIACSILRVKDDYDGKSGIAVGTKT
jgi:uncharacterized protein DUF6260